MTVLILLVAGFVLAGWVITAATTRVDTTLNDWRNQDHSHIPATPIDQWWIDNYGGMGDTWPADDFELWTAEMDGAA